MSNETVPSPEVAPQYQRRVVKDLLGSLGTSLLVDRSFEKGTPSRRIDSRLAHQLHKDYLPHPVAGLESAVAEYSKHYDEVSLWHGTGRYQYDEDGNVVDVLSSILDQRGLTPAEDGYDLINGVMVTTSFARSRMYARAYADMHGNGSEEPNRYGDSGFWATYIASRLPLDALRELRPWRRDSRKTLADNLKNRSTKSWGAKVHSGFQPDEHGDAQLRGIFSAFYSGSDIDDNYPVLFGIHTAVPEAPLAKSIARHEVRTDERIALDYISHVEVPFERIDETEELLRQHGVSLPVFAIETGEEYCSRQPFSRLLYPQANGISSSSAPWL